MTLYVSREPGLMWWINWLELFDHMPHVIWLALWWWSMRCDFCFWMALFLTWSIAVWLLMMKNSWCSAVNFSSDICQIIPRRANTNANNKYKMLIQIQTQFKMMVQVKLKCKYKNKSKTNTNANANTNKNQKLRQKCYAKVDIKMRFKRNQNHVISL